MGGTQCHSAKSGFFTCAELIVANQTPVKLLWAQPTDSSVTAAFVEHHTSASTAAIGPPTVSESQTEKPAHPPRKRLKLGPLKGWGVQRDEVSMSAADYAQKYWDEFKEVSGLPYSFTYTLVDSL
ncbi:hypothetical protein C8R45DRAFT_923237 [Mycena sanguinolenta]|nr:hypothetical protein C8R45DRAFT_923237 [Mycena sanguinolenta]